MPCRPHLHRDGSRESARRLSRTRTIRVTLPHSRSNATNRGDGGRAPPTHRRARLDCETRHLPAYRLRPKIHLLVDMAVTVEHLQARVVGVDPVEEHHEYEGDSQEQPKWGRQHFGIFVNGHRIASAARHDPTSTVCHGA